MNILGLIPLLLNAGKYLAFAYFILVPFGYIYLGLIPFFEEDLDTAVHLYLRAALILHPILAFTTAKAFVKSYIKALLYTGALISLETFIGFEHLFKAKDIDGFNYVLNLVNATLFIFIVGRLLIKQLFRKRPKSNKKETTTNTPSRIVFKAKPKSIYLDNPERGIYIQGGAGSGKSESIFKPIIESYIRKSSTGVLYDFKSGSLTKYIFHYLNKHNSNTTAYFVDFKNPLKSHRVNPLYPEYLKKSAYAIEYAQVLINNLLPETIKERNFWDRDAQSVLAGVIWYMKKNQPKYCSLPHIIALLLNADIKVLLDLVSTDAEASGMVTSLRQAIERNAEKQVAGVASTLQTALSRLNTADIFWLLSGNDLSLDINDPENPKFLCLGNDSTLYETYAPAVSLIISVYTRLMNVPDKHPSALIFDEFPTIYLPKIEQMPATGRENKISTVIGVQDYFQMNATYGEVNANVMLSNLGNQFYGRTTNAKTAEMIKAIFSKEDKTYITNSENTGSSGKIVHFNTNDGKGKNESIQERDRVKVSDIIHMSPGHFYGIIAEGKPREFLNYKFKRDTTKVESNSINVPSHRQQQLEDNYLRIIKEAKSILNTQKTEDTNASLLEF